MTNSIDILSAKTPLTHLLRKAAPLALGIAAALSASTVQAFNYTTKISNYNGRGLPSNVTIESNGDEIHNRSYSWNSNGQLIYFSDPLGTRSFSYENNQLKTFAQPNGPNLEILERDAQFGYPTKIKTKVGPNSETNATGVDTTVSYNNYGEMTNITTPGAGINLVNSRDLMGRPLQETRNQGTSQQHLNQYSYYPNGALKTMTINDGGATNETLTTNYSVTNTGFGGYKVASEQVTGSGHTLTTTNEYDVLGRLTKTVETDGSITLETTFSYQYNVTDNTVMQCLSGGCTLIHIDLPNGGSSSKLFDAMGNLAREISPRRETTAYIYDGLNRLVLKVEALGAMPTTEPTVNALYNAPLLLRTEYGYDQWGNLARQVSYYDTNGSGMQDANETMISQQSWQYNDKGQMIEARIGASDNAVVRTFGYDGQSRMTSMTEQGGQNNNFSRNSSTWYDKGLLRQVQVNSTGQTHYRKWEYNDEGQVTAFNGHQTGNGDKVSYEYTDNGQIKKIIFTDSQAGNQEIIYGYDVLGRLKTVNLPAVGATGDISYQYDAFGRQLSASIGDKTQTWSYHGDGRLNSMTDFSGRTTNYSYDSIGRLTKIDRAGSEDDIEFRQFDSNNQPLEIVTFQGGEQVLKLYTDMLGRVVRQDHPTHTVFTEYSTDKNQVSTRLQINDQPELLSQQLFDTAGRMIQSAQWVGPNKKQDIRYSYNIFGLDRATRYQGDVGDFDVNSEYYYLDTGEIDRIRHEKALAWYVQYDLGYNRSVPYSSTEEVNLNNRFEEIAGNLNQMSFDNQGRMTRYQQIKNGQSKWKNYSYNAQGKLVSMPDIGTITYDNRGWLANAAGATSDGQGNVVNSVVADLANINTVYDQQDRIIQAGNIGYRYGPDGNLRETCETAGCSTYYHDAVTGQILAINSSEFGMRFYNYGANGELTGDYDPSTDTTRLFLSNAQGSVITSLSSTGIWQGSRAYSPYGAMTADSIPNLPIGYLGQLQHTNGLVQFGSNLYNPYMGVMLNASGGQTAFAGGQPLTANLAGAEFINPYPLMQTGVYTPNATSMLSHLALGVASMAADAVGYGTAGAVFDGLDTALSLSEGDYVGAAIGAGAAAVPFAASGLVKLFGNTTETASRSARVLSPCCFEAGTLVTTATGLIPIEALEVGDLVLAQNDKTGEQAYKPVKTLFINPDKTTIKLSFELIDGTQDSFVVTDNHPYMTVNGWVDAGELKVGMQITTANGELATLKQISHQAEPIDTYNIEVADFNTYFVGDSQVLVHNCNLPPRKQRVFAEGFTPRLIRPKAVTKSGKSGRIDNVKLFRETQDGTSFGYMINVATGQVDISPLPKRIWNDEGKYWAVSTKWADRPKRLDNSVIPREITIGNGGPHMLLAERMLGSNAKAEAATLGGHFIGGIFVKDPEAINSMRLMFSSYTANHGLTLRVYGKTNSSNLIKDPKIQEQVRQILIETVPIVGPVKR